VSDWANFKGGEEKAATNPKYCYEWSFLQPGKVAVLNLWYEDLKKTDGEYWRELNMLRTAQREKDHNRKRRALNMDHHIRTAYIEGLPVRVVVLDGRRNDETGPARANRRELDAERWAVTMYDWETGEALIERGAKPHAAASDDGDEEWEGFEGEQRIQFVLHRRRERLLRRKKLADARRLNNGRLICEVPNCGFDFVKRYGELGDGYAQVHHLSPLSNAPDAGHSVTLKDLAVVCANCHAMIHRNGKCRSLKELIPIMVFQS
jgi:hypothetical protein